MIRSLILPTIWVLGMMACKSETVDPCEFNLTDCDETGIQENVEQENVESESCKAKRGDLIFPAAGETTIDPAFFRNEGEFFQGKSPNPPGVSRTGVETYLGAYWPAEPDSYLTDYLVMDTTLRWKINGTDLKNPFGESWHIFEQPGTYEIAYSMTVMKYYADGDTCLETIAFEDTKSQIKVWQSHRIRLTDLTFIWDKRKETCSEDFFPANVWNRCADIFVESKGQGIRTSTVWNKRWQDDKDHSWERSDTLQLIADYSYIEFKVLDDDIGNGGWLDDLHHIFLFTPENTQNWSPGVHELIAPNERSNLEPAVLRITLEAL